MNQEKNHEISLQTAIEMTSLYRANRPSNFPLSEAFGISAVQKLLAADGAAYLRIYYGMKENQEVHAILVAADSDGQDILPEAGVEPASAGEGGIIEDAFRCPPFCPGGGSPLGGQ